MGEEGGEWRRRKSIGQERLKWWGIGGRGDDQSSWDGIGSLLFSVKEQNRKNV
ncbi:hypothetical protein [Bartonella sp. B1098]|uniref:hypothetical protein n=1 Tax=Bartonella sp. B1098 TaxID=2911421 RepID=UPI0020C4862D|nr:hypothetical protein [Bartonella sp. B1098]